MVLNKKFIQLFFFICLSSLLFRMGFPGFSVPFLSILGLALYFECLRQTSHPFLSGVLFGSLFNMSLCPWIFQTLIKEFSFPVPVALLFFILVIGVLLSSEFAIFSYIFKIFQRKNKNKSSFFEDFRLSLTAGALFSVTEWIKILISPEHGWFQVGTIFYKTPSIFVWSRWAGGEFLSFTCFFLACLLWLSFLRISQKNYRRGAMLFLILFSCAGMLKITGINFLENAAIPEKEVTVEAALIHSGVAQSKRWKKKYYQENLSIYKSLSESSFSDHKDNLRLIIWPETSLATYEIQQKGDLYKWLKKICKAKKLWFIGGFPAYSKYKNKKRFYNSAFSISPKGKIKDRYDKHFLLPFAERKFSFFKFSSERKGREYSPGTSNEIFILTTNNNTKIYAGINICYETGIVSLIHKAALQKMQFLINLSNDAWFHDSSESLQQLSMTALRCCENGVPGIRSTGYGTAAFIDRFGRVTGKTLIKGASIIKDTINIPENPDNFARKYHQWFIIFSLIILLSEFIIMLLD